MPRPRKFDEDEALDAAIGRFWRQGYAGTTIRDLSSDMKMTTASLYNAFGDKRGLFIRALRRYVAEHSLGSLTSIANADDPIQALVEFLDGLVQDAATTGQGCLLISSAAEVPTTDHVLRKEIREHLNSIESALKLSLEAARRKSLVSATLDCAEQARSVLSAIISIQVLARTGGQPMLLATIAQSAIPPTSRIPA